MSVDTDTEYYEYIFDSAEATRSNSAQHTSLNWPVFEFENVFSDVVALKVLEVTIPNSWYTITSTNNTFIVHDNGSNTNFTIVILPGSYNQGSLAATVKDSLDTITGYVWTINFIPVTGKFVFSALNGVTPVNFYFVFGNAGTDWLLNPRFFLGFNAGQSVSGTEITSPNYAGISGENYIYVCSNILGNSMNLHLPVTTGLSKGGLGPEMAMVPVNADFNSLVTWSDKSSEFVFYTPGINSLQYIDIYLTLGLTTDVLDLNGLPFQIKLGILKRRASYQTQNQYLGIKRTRAI